MNHELKTGGDRGYLRIATEEAFATREQIEAIMRLVREGRADRGTMSLWGFYGTSPSARARSAWRSAARMAVRSGWSSVGGMDRACDAAANRSHFPLNSGAAQRPSPRRDTGTTMVWRVTPM